MIKNNIIFIKPSQYILLLYFVDTIYIFNVAIDRTNSKAKGSKRLSQPV